MTEREKMIFRVKDGITFHYVETYKDVRIYEQPTTGHCIFGRKFSLNLERAKKEIDRLEPVGLLGAIKAF